MNRVVWKYPLTFATIQHVELPACAEILHVARQNLDPMLWAMVDPDHHLLTERRRIVLLATGERMPVKDGETYLGPPQYLGTIHCPSALLPETVWHVFEVPAASTPDLALYPRTAA